MSRHAAETRRRGAGVLTSAHAAAAPIRSGRRQQWRGTGFGTQVWVLTARSVHTAFGDVKLVFFSLLQPVVLLLLFSQVFKSVATLPGVVEYRSYINFLMPATLVNVAMTTAMSSGIGLMAEVYTGFVGRLRAMPVSMFAVLLARTLSDAIRLAVQLVIIVLAAIVVLDFRPGSMLGLADALLLTVVVGWGVGWVFVAIVTWQRKAEVVQAISFIVMFPLMFASSAYMPVNAMPTWIRLLARVNPITYTIDATRALALGRPVGWALALALGLVAGTALLGGTTAARNFRRAG